MFRFLSIIILVLFAAAPAYALTGDMFGDASMAFGNRPWVPGDRDHPPAARADMFGRYEPIMRTDKGMFDRVYAPGSPGMERHFSAHHVAVPSDPLYRWPRGEE